MTGKTYLYPSTYLFMKASCCHFMSCKYDGDCEKCKEYGLLRRHAAKDDDELLRLRRKLRLIRERLESSTEQAGAVQDIQKIIKGQDNKPSSTKERNKKMTITITNAGVLWIVIGAAIIFASGFLLGNACKDMPW